MLTKHTLLLINYDLFLKKIPTTMGERVIKKKNKNRKNLLHLPNINDLSINLKQ